MRKQNMIQIDPMNAPAADMNPLILGYFGSYLSQMYPPINSLGIPPNIKMRKYKVVY